MSIETDLYSTLAANGAVAALVATRIYAGHAPENAAVPYIVYSLSSTERFHTLLGVSDPARYQFQIENVAATYAAGKTLSAAVTAALQGNGHQQFTYDLYDEITQQHTMIVGWSFISS